VLSCARTWRVLAAARFAALVLPLAFGTAAFGAPESHFAFAVVANVMTSPADEPAARRLIDAIGLDRRNAFLVYDGNLKGLDEPCADALYDRRLALLDASRAPVVFVPGQHDWTTCGLNGAGGYDPVERLDLLRQTFFANPTTLGQNPLAVTRESELSRFRPYRENVRWQFGDTVFVAMNVPNGNNHYLNAGGRNGEFEDRVIANRFWLERAAEYARRTNARAIVIFIEADPMPARSEHAKRFDWLPFSYHPRDGYEEFRHDLIRVARSFRGPIVIVHTVNAKLPRGFVIDQPLRGARGKPVANVTRIAFSLRAPLTQWLEVDDDMKRRPPLRVSVRNVPRNLPPLPPLSPNLTVPTPGAAVPDVASIPDYTEIPGMPQAPAFLPGDEGAPASAIAPPPDEQQPGGQNPPGW